MNGTIPRVEINSGIMMDRQGFDEGRTASTSRGRPGEAHGCDGCGGISPDVDLWAADPESSDEIWLCFACGDW
jgi:hypothetical protein